MSDKSTLQDMGFEASMVDRALAATDNKGLQPALDWLVAHGSTFGEEPTAEAGPGDNDNDNDNDKEDNNETNTEEAPDKKELTATEKMARADQIQRRLAERRKEREEKQKQEAIEKEKIRRLQGQDLALAKDRLAQKEMQQLAAQRKKEKDEDRKRMEELRRQIELDKEERRRKLNPTKSQEEEEVKPAKAAKTVSSSSAGNNTSQSKKDARIQVRRDGQVVLSKTFSGESTVRELYEAVNNAGGHGVLAMTFPRKRLEDMDQQLWEAGLVPSAVLLLQ